MKILIVSETLTVGGAETFTLRLVSKLQERGVNATLYVFYQDKINKQLLAEYPFIKPISPNIPFLWFLNKLDSLFLKLKIDFSIIEFIIKNHLRNFILCNNITTIHGNLFKTDIVILKSIKNLTEINFISTNHGDYTLYFKKLNLGEDLRILNLKKKVSSILSRLNSIVCIAENQIQFFKNFIEANLKSNQKHIALEKIYNGYYLKKSNSKTNINLPEGTFVFGMVSRGIKEKGWEYAIESFIELNNSSTALILVGKGEYLDTLAIKFKSYKNIYFVGFSANPTEWIQLFNVGLLPSYYSAESLPTVIIEYLALNKPVICTDIGECKAMITSKEETAGDTILLEHSRLIDVKKLKSIMHKYLDSSYYQNKKEKTTLAFKKFDMNTCIDHYLKLYK